MKPKNTYAKCLEIRKELEDKLKKAESVGDKNLKRLYKVQLKEVKSIQRQIEKDIEKMAQPSIKRN